ncbi:putative dynactin subunit 4 [Neospora caninum Liverpool]|uniref:Dynactin subunit 4 n=1 Tax=Neospora caninum (strain Liverpool) TaxID=572307 RepID=F0VP06_NEOCL|nr:putative dynactin subunit 4 [Neospora caninum Liverpool]CBZ55452.1 putative dynactin subunit 4 [Neospora caninum Liverpool]CEL70187.1 TPA: dynactin subunit 4, putative [Neospora caninum Liverpool]|eukprot:XP_003885480.1 putative dynactin subunit 4 [Neospora caninum Liverpool]
MSDSDSDVSNGPASELPPLPVPPPLPRAPTSLGPLPETRRPEVFLLPQTRQAVIPVSRAYVCDACRAVRGPEDLSVEIESYFCPACLDVMPQTEALACSCRCTKCFDCPRCFATLGVVREPREAAETGRDAGEALAAANALVAEGAAPTLGPQRCDSLLSISSEEDAEEAERRSAGGNGDGKSDAGEKFEYVFACTACKWSSRPLDMKSRVSALLPAAGTAEERGGRIRRCFSPIFEALQAAAQERERTRQLEARVKHKAVALLFAAAAARGNFPGRGLGRLQRDRTWRVADVDEMLAKRTAEIARTDIWANVRQDGQPAPQRVSLADLVAGKHLAPTREVVSEFDWNRRLQQDMFREDAEDADEDFTAEETKALEPLNANQVLVDRRTPDLAPVKVPDDVWGGVGRAREAGGVDEATVDDFPTVEQRLRNPNATVVAEMSGALLHPTRKRLLTRQSKRCRVCQKFVVKSQVSPNAVPPLRLNSAAALLLPLMYPRIRDGTGLEGLVDVEIGVVNPTEVPMFLSFHLAHGPEEDAAQARGLTEASPREGREPSSGKAGEAERGLASERQYETVRRNWQTLDILTKNFDVALDPYDEMLEELNSEVEELRADDDPTIVLARKGNTVLLRLRVRAKKWAVHQVGACCMTVDVAVADDNPVRVCYVLTLGRIAPASEPELVRRESL